MEISKNNRFFFHVSKHSKDMLRQNVRILRADLASTAFKKADKVSRKSTTFIRHFI